ncbi:NB-ARC domain-containing protein [Altericista sp. CCNU0014]|uniref:NB-ARC domain-containing protein n=1 Tax=Altericista sp. CCNU0014 TaxID=3082949 RepID=UPI00384F9CAD
MGSTSTLSAQKLGLKSEMNSKSFTPTSSIEYLLNSYESSLYLEDDTLKPPQLQELLEWICQELPVSEIQMVILSESWCGNTYQKIAKNAKYNFSYVKDLGHKLWRELSELFGENITKQNFRAVILRQYQLRQRKAPSLKPIAGARSPENCGAAKKGCKELHDAQKLEQFVAVECFHGRNSELTSLREWILLHKVQLLGIFGMAGCGKTTLAMKCVERVRKHFECILWRSLRDTPDFSTFICSILNSLEEEIDADPSEDVNTLVSRLLEYFENNRVLLVIDDWSAVFKDRVLAGIYQEETKKYGLLLRRLSEKSHKSCVLITSREKPFGLAFNKSSLNYNSQTQYIHVNGLTGSDGLQAIESFGLPNCESSAAERLIRYYSGNPYALKIAVNTIYQIFDGKLSSFLSNENLIYGGIKELLKSQFDRISDIEKDIFINLSQRSNPIMLEELTGDSSFNNHFVQFLEGFESLLNRTFIEKKGELFEVPEIFRNYLSHESF